MATGTIKESPKIVTETFHSAVISIGAGAVGHVTINTEKPGYKAIGVVGVQNLSADVLLAEFSTDVYNKTTIYYKNTKSESITGSMSVIVAFVKSGGVTRNLRFYAPLRDRRCVA